jgi:hypothetical protein
MFEGNFVLPCNTNSIYGYICIHTMKHCLEYDGIATSNVLLEFFLLVWLVCAKVQFYVASQVKMLGCEVQ